VSPRRVGSGHPRVLDDAGTTLVELLVAMTLTLVVSGLITGALVSELRTNRSVAADTEARASAVAAGELLADELRDATAVTAAQPSSVTFWIDRNSDYVRQDVESRTWQLDAATHSLCRTISSSRQCFGAARLTGVDFAYRTDPDATTIRSVDVTVHYAGQPAARTQQWTVALDNAS
jgi:Tfp pilus assembly protein PilW